MKVCIGCEAEEGQPHQKWCPARTGTLSSLTDSRYSDSGHYCGARWPNLGGAGGEWTCTLDAGHGGEDHVATGHGGRRLHSLSSSIGRGDPDLTYDPEEAPGGDCT